MLFGYFWGDWTFLILIPAMIFAFVAQSKVNSTFNRYAKVYNRRGLTGAEAARRVLDANGLYHVTIERVHGRLTDHYDPRANVIRLSDAVYGSTGIAAVEEEKRSEGKIYDLNGRRVYNPTEGIYIKKGKKIFVK